MGLAQLAISAVLVVAIAWVILGHAELRKGSDLLSLILAVIVASPPALLAAAAVFGSNAVPAAPSMTLPTAASSQSVPSGPCGAESASASDRSATKLRVVSGWVMGSVDHSQVLGHSVQLCGWAASVQDRHAADSVLIFANGMFVGAIRPTIARPDLVRVIGSAGANAGYSVQLPLGLFERGGKKAKVQVFGIERGMASLLPAGCMAEPHDFGCPPA